MDKIDKTKLNEERNELAKTIKDAKESVEKLLAKKENAKSPNKETKLEPVVDEKKAKNSTTSTEKEAQDLKNEISLEIDAKDTEKEFKKETPENQKKIELGFKTLGFWLEQKKNDWFVKGYSKLSEQISVEKNPATKRFLENLAKNFKKDSEKTYEKWKSNEQAHGLQKAMGTFQNVGYAVGNIVRYGRTILDIAQVTASLPYKYITMIAMTTETMAQAGKETRFQNEELLDKTHIEYAEVAATEAWALYEQAEKEAKDGKVSAADLQKTYLMRMPADLTRRLQEPRTANNFVQNMLHKSIEADVKHWTKKIEKIHQNPNLTEEQKKIEEEKYIKNQESWLLDYDRMLDRYGMIDNVAQITLIVEKTGWLTKQAMTAISLKQLWENGEKLILNAEKIYEDVSHFVSGHDLSFKIPFISFGDKLTALNDTSTTIDTTSINSNPDNIIPGQHNPAIDTTSNSQNVPADTSHIKDTTTVENISRQNNTIPEAIQTPVAQPAPVVEHTVEVNLNAIVKPGDGITQAFAAQMKADPNLALKLGFHGDINNKQDVAQFTKELAIKTGYIDTEGHEVRVAEADKVAYELKVENGNVIVDEKSVDGKIFETHNEGDKFEKEVDEYEKAYTKSPVVENIKVADQIKDEYVDTSKDVKNEFKDTSVDTKVAETATATAAISVNESATNPFNLSEERLNEVEKIHQNNIGRLMPITSGDSTKDNLAKVNLSIALQQEAKIMLTLTEEDSKYPKLTDYVKKLHKITDLEPLGKNIIDGREAETIEKYILRAEMKAAEIDRLEDIIIYNQSSSNLSQNEIVEKKPIDIEQLEHKEIPVEQPIEEVKVPEKDIGINYDTIQTEYINPKVGDISDDKLIVGFKIPENANLRSESFLIPWTKDAGNKYNNFIGGDLKFEYNQSGTPVRFSLTNTETGYDPRGIYFNKSPSSDKLLNNGRQLYTELGIYKYLKTTGGHSKELEFLEKIILNKINLIEKEGNIIDFSKLPEEFQK
jgi:hypothetical protein